MTSSEDSADDFESADEDFGTNDQFNTPTSNSKKEENKLLKDSSDNGLQHGNTISTLQKSINNLQVTNQDIFNSNSNRKLPDLSTETPDSLNTQSIPHYTSSTDSLVNDNTFKKKNDEGNNSPLDFKKIDSSNMLSNTNEFETHDKEANLTIEIINAAQILEKRSLDHQQSSTNNSITTEQKSKDDDHQNEPVLKNVPNRMLDDKNIIADEAELGDGWDLEEDDLEATLVNDAIKAVLEHGNSSKQHTVNTNSKSSEGWDDFEVENDEGFTENPGDGWEIEGEESSDIPTISDENIVPTLEHSSDLKEIESKHLDQKGWGGWGGWGVSSLLSTATGSVTTFSSHVTAGLSSVLETTVGAPDPETLATNVAHSTNIQDSNPEMPEEKQHANYVGLGSFVSGVGFLGSTVINRGLDTLETLGKKTMEVLQEGDPGLMKKRAMLFSDQDKPVLSQILREAKEKADQSDKEKEEKEVARKVHFESLFDDYNGMVHLEALEMLSTQCDLKLQTLAMSQSGAQLEELQETLSQVRDLCELPEDDEDSEVLSAQQLADLLTKCMAGLKISLTAAKIIQVNDKVIDRINVLRSESAVTVHQAAISSLAEFTATGMEFFHKSAELLLAKTSHNTLDEADNYVQLTSHLCARVSAIANEFTQLLTNNHPIANSSMITNIFLEASNSSSYMRNACQLLVPILQVGAIKA